MPSRRDLLRAGAAWGACLAVARIPGMGERRRALTGGSQALLERLAAQTICPEAGPAGELLGTVPFLGDRAASTPLGTMVGGTGLDARLFTDLSRLEPGKLLTPADQVFVRTAGPEKVAPLVLERWQVAVRGTNRAEAIVAASEIAKAATPLGAHLIECAGNSDPQNFGLMSLAEWDGVRLGDLQKRVGAQPDAVGVLVRGWDHDVSASGRSVPGASWVFRLDTFEKLGAFFAVRMNGQPLTLDHGAPVRLVVPGWYGCAWIKWVNEVRLVKADEPATTQMLEFASRTHQEGAPARALEYAPPAIDLAATPVRIEKRRLDGRLEYRIVGIVWGGNRPAERLMIRFAPNDSFKPFTICPRPLTHRIWSLWEYRWRPQAPGLYSIVLQVGDPSIRARRLDLSYYIRRVNITEV